MLIRDNPYTSSVFVKTWLSHFGKGAITINLNFISGVSFIKHPSFPYWTNTGRNHTKGISYEPVPVDIGSNLENRPVLIYDVPGYFDINEVKTPVNIGKLRVKQYQGFLIDLEPYQDLEHYLKEHFSKSSRYKLKKFKKRLEQSFDITYTMHSGAIDTKAYDRLFEQFRILLTRRFEDKQENNNNLDPKEWSFYKESTFALMKINQAGLFVVYSKKEPISITLVNLSESVLFDAITVFDIDYSRFQLGSITIMALIDWSLQNGYVILDFSKGYFPYKTRWATKAYDFEYHIFYDKNQNTSRITARLLQQFLVIKNGLRRRGYHKLFRSIKYRLTFRSNGVASKKTTNIMMETSNIDEISGVPIERGSNEYDELFHCLCDFVYLSGDHIDRTFLYRSEEGLPSYIIRGQESGKVARIPKTKK